MDATEPVVVQDAGSDTSPVVVQDAGIEAAAELKQVEIPTFSVPGGRYSEAQVVTISSATTGADIWYTVNGSTPIPKVSTQYSGPISVAASLNYQGRG